MGLTAYTLQNIGLGLGARPKSSHVRLTAYTLQNIGLGLGARPKSSHVGLGVLRGSWRAPGTPLLPRGSWRAPGSPWNPPKPWPGMCKGNHIMILNAIQTLQGNDPSQGGETGLQCVLRHKGYWANIRAQSCHKGYWANIRAKSCHKGYWANIRAKSCHTGYWANTPRGTRSIH